GSRAASEKFNAPAMRIQGIDDLPELLRLSAMLRPLNALHAIEQLRHVRRTTAARADEQEFVADTIVVAKVLPLLVPHKRSLVFEPPCADDLKALLQQR